MFDKIINLKFVTISYCHVDKSPFWNLALTNKNMAERESYLGLNLVFRT